MATKEAVSTPAQAVKADPVFTKEDLIKSAAVLGTTPALLTGALYGVKKETLTKKEAVEALNGFLKKPVHKGVK